MSYMKVRQCAAPPCGTRGEYYPDALASCTGVRHTVMALLFNLDSMTLQERFFKKWSDRLPRCIRLLDQPMNCQSKFQHNTT